MGMPLAIMVRFKPMLQAEILPTRGAGYRNKLLLLASGHTTSVGNLYSKAKYLLIHNTQLSMPALMFLCTL
jgi:hypothetical protein